MYRFENISPEAITKSKSKRAEDLVKGKTKDNEKIYKMWFFKELNYKDICHTVNISFFQLEKVILKLAAINFSKDNNKFSVVFERTYEDVKIQNSNYLRCARKTHEFYNFQQSDHKKLQKQKDIILKRCLDFQLLKDQIKEDIIRDVLQGIQQKEVARKYFVSEYFVSSTVTGESASQKKIIQKNKTKKALNNLKEWFEGRIITLETKALFETVGVYDLVKAGNIKKAEAVLLQSLNTQAN